MSRSENKQKSIITVTDITIRIRDRFILPHTSWDILAGQHWAVLGPNGAGKSSLVRALIGDIPHVRGHITYHLPQPIDKMISYVSSELQEYLIAREEHRDLERCFARKPDDFETAKESILSGDHDGHGFHPELERISDLMGIHHLLDRGIRHLSTGEMRKVIIARALIKSPAILILDEPFTGIDAESRAQLKESIDALMRQGMQVILVTHRREEMLPLISHMLYIKNGSVILQGKREEILAQEGMIRLYEEKKDTHSFPSVYNHGTEDDKKIAQKQETLVKMKSVTVRYGDVQVINDLSWTMKRGDHWAIVGPNGSGKTTLLSLISGDNPQAYANEIYLFGRRRGSGESIWEIKARIGVISNEFQLRYRKEIPMYDVVASGIFDSIGLYRKLTEEQHRLVRKWLHFFGLAPMADRIFMRLSYGEKRMVLLARAMVKSPDLLILDEPVQGLDPENRRRVLEIIDKIGDSTDTSMIYVTHYPDERPKCINKVLTLIKPCKDER